MCSKHRDYVITWNNYTPENYNTLVALDSRYIVIGKEIGASGTPHLQGYVYFENPRSFNAIQKKIKGAHIEVRSPNATPEQAAIYCKKDGDYYERGDVPEQGKRSDVETVREQLADGNGMRGVVRVATNLASIKIAEAILKYEEPQRNWKTNITWFWGPTETGKSKKAHEIFEGKDFYRKTANTGKWWDGYDAHAYVIIDDFVFPENVTDYKNWLDIFDRYGCMIQTKGGVRQFLAKRIIVTSSTSPHSSLQHFEQNGREFIRRLGNIYEFDAGGCKGTIS